MQDNHKRDALWEQLARSWDVVIVGGGITGAGILREATRMGLRALLVEQRDFAWGTSSRSSKLVHGGLRYLRQGRLSLTRASVRERERLLREAPGLVEPLDFLWVTYEGDRPGRWLFQLGLAVYDLLAGHWNHRFLRPAAVARLAPYLNREGLVGGFTYGDAQTDDARLVLRLIQEATAGRGVAINYVRAEQVLRGDGGLVRGVRVRDEIRERSADVYANSVINATGAWADRLRGQVVEREKAQRIRPLRGSHLVFPGNRLPVAQAISFAHPLDGRPVYIMPWERITLVGTTDVDHGQGLEWEPRISKQEVAYLMAAVEAHFGSLAINLEDAISTFAGVRAVVDSGKSNPSEESREHVVWEEDGLLTVTGGKLTTFRLVAQDALAAIGPRLGIAQASIREQTERILNDFTKVKIGPSDPGALDEAARQRLWGRYGALAPEVARAARPGELARVPGSHCLWAEVRWAARAEGAVHLEDVMLRRTRLGLMLPEGGAALLERIGEICQCEMGWDDARREEEEAAYRTLWRRCYSVPAV